QLLAEKFEKEDAAAITKVDEKILIRGTKRAVVTSDAEKESTSSPSRISSRTEDGPARTRIIGTTPDVKSLAGDIVISDGDDAPVVRVHHSDKKKGTDEDPDDLPHVSGAQSDDDADVPLVRPGGQSPVGDTGEDENTKDNADALTPQAGAGVQNTQVQPVDAVWEIVTADPLLADTYKDLPLLQRSDGQVSFSAWGEHIACHNFPTCQGEDLCEHRRASMDYIKSAIVFQRKDIRMDSNRIHPAICVSLIAVTECYLIRPVQFGNYLQKTIYGVLHTVEWERFTTVACQAFNAIG
ncbi:hypothetical protein NEOLEDRAFT_1152887, partial [Neolentinus lepideus HHB14362 ss-1]